MSVFLLLSLTGPLAGDGPDGVPAEYRRGVAQALVAAGENRGQLVAALEAARPEHREAAAFLVAHMPERDLTSLTSDYLIENVELACQARAEMPWGKDVPDELFLNDVLPYASINERRDRWRRGFYRRFAPLVGECETPGEAARTLNRTIFETLGVQYHATKRPKPDQSPFESMAAGYASCSGLSVLLIDACRAVCVPARFVGTPRWVTQRENHSWVEVWDGRCWRFLGAAEPGPLDRTWFVARAREADLARPEHRIYAASFRRTATRFPLVWDLEIRYVPAVDVTPFYAARRTVRFLVLDKPRGRPVPATLTLRLGGRIVAQAGVHDPVELIVAGGQGYEATIQPRGGPTVRRQVSVPDEQGQTIILTLE
ncbi:MAG: transglutaminase-like domain-containing protein [Planctomycetota bacterium]